MAASWPPADSPTRAIFVRIHVVLCCVGLNEADGFLHIADAGPELRHVLHEAIANREPGETSIRERLEERLDIVSSIAADPSSTMNDDDCGDSLADFR